MPAAPAPLPGAASIPYDFAAAEALLRRELPNLSGNVAVIVRQDGRDLFRFQAGSIDHGTQVRLASFTKTISAAVILRLWEEGVLRLDERLGDAFPNPFQTRGIGDPTFLDCWAMRHGIETNQEFHRDSRFTHQESVARIGFLGFEEFRPATQLGYDGCGMHVVGFAAAQRLGIDWDAVARTRLFDPLGMANSDYGQFAPNPAVAGGLRSSAEATMRVADLLIGRGVLDGQRFLSDTSIDVMFTNYTRDLPVESTPWPSGHPDYPYGVDPDYAFGAWVLAENPVTQHVEEIIGAGAWGSYIWIDRRRGLTAVLITDVRPGTQLSMDAALGLCREARTAVEARQVRGLAAVATGRGVRLTWQDPEGSRFARVFGSALPLRDRFDLMDAQVLGVTDAETFLASPFDHYAVVAGFRVLENTALVPGENSIVRPGR